MAGLAVGGSGPGVHCDPLGSDREPPGQSGPDNRTRKSDKSDQANVEQQIEAVHEIRPITKDAASVEIGAAGPIPLRCP